MRDGMINKGYALQNLHKILEKDIFETPVREYYRLRRSKMEVARLKGKFAGERCFLVGNGPSLNKIDLALLKAEYSFGVNLIFYKTQEMGYRPTFYTVEDPHIVNDRADEINRYECDYMFLPVKFKSRFKTGDNRIFINQDYSFYNRASPYFEIPRFSQDCSEEVFCGQSVTILNLQLAYYLGFSEVYLIGMDFDYVIPDSAVVHGAVIESTEADVNHFHPDYFGEGKKWHDPKLHNVMKSYRLAKLMYELDGRSIFNATVGGKLELFDRVDFYSLFS